MLINPGLALYDGTDGTDGTGADASWATNDQNSIDAILSNLGIVNELYKSEAAGQKSDGTTTPQTELGLLTGSYETTYSPFYDASDAIIEHTADTPIATDGFLLVKDGNNEPW